MSDIEIKRGYEILPENRVRFGIRLINKGDTAISEVKVILDYSQSLFELEGSEIEKLETIPPSASRTAKFTLKPLSCVHNEKIGATISYKDPRWETHTLEVRSKEIHCICPFLKEKQIERSDFLKLLKSGYPVERSVNFGNISIEKLVELLSHTCKNRLYKVDEFSIKSGKVLYLAGDSRGEEAYYLLTATVREREDILQVILYANSDKSFGVHGFLNEILDNLRHLVKSVSPAMEITTIKNEQVINISDSVVMHPNFSGKIKTEAVNIESSVVPLSDIGLFNDEDKEKDTEKKSYIEQDENEQTTNKKEEIQSKRTQTELFVKQEIYEPHKRVKEENKEKVIRHLDIEKLLEEPKKAQVIKQPVSHTLKKEEPVKKPKDLLGKNPHIFGLVIVVAILILVVTLSMASNRTDDLASNITVAEQPVPPVANFSADVKIGNAPLEVTFTDMSKNATEWSWNFGDGDISTKQSPVHTYSTAGNYTVEETVSNEKGNSSTERKPYYIHVEPPLPPLVANFSADMTVGNVPLTVQFIDESTGSPTRWEWSFGDGNISTERNPTYTYSTVGTYTVKETVFRETINDGTESKHERKIGYITVT